MIYMLSFRQLIVTATQEPLKKKRINKQMDKQKQ